jgi:hypothetical protein
MYDYATNPYKTRLVVVTSKKKFGSIDPLAYKLTQTDQQPITSKNFLPNTSKTYSIQYCMYCTGTVKVLDVQSSIMDSNPIGS